MEGGMEGWRDGDGGMEEGWRSRTPWSKAHTRGTVTPCNPLGMATSPAPQRNAPVFPPRAKYTPQPQTPSSTTPQKLHDTPSPLKGDSHRPT